MNRFDRQGEVFNVTPLESYEVCPGVHCDTYSFDDTDKSDLAIVKMDPWTMTPRQRVLKGDQTIEGILSGTGALRVTDEEDVGTVHQMSPENHTEVTVEVGQIMQWVTREEGLTFYEICTPPYTDDRFEEIDKSTRAQASE